MHFADPFEIFYTVFNGYDEPKWGAVACRQRLAVHFVAQQGLRVHGAWHVDSCVVLAVGCAEADVVEGRFGGQAIVLYEVAEPAAAPPGDLAPAFDTFEFEGKFRFW